MKSVPTIILPNVYRFWKNKSRLQTTASPISRTKPLEHEYIGGKTHGFCIFWHRIRCLHHRYLLPCGNSVKQTPLANKWLPSICGALGGLLGLAAMYINVPDFPAADPLTALAVGIVSGLAATGADQVIKQIGNDN